MYTAGNIIERGVTAAEHLEHAGYGSTFFRGPYPAHGVPQMTDEGLALFDHVREEGAGYRPSSPVVVVCPIPYFPN